MCVCDRPTICKKIFIGLIVLLLAICGFNYYVGGIINFNPLLILEHEFGGGEDGGLFSEEIYSTESEKAMGYLVKGEIDQAFATVEACEEQDPQCQAVLGELYIIAVDRRNITKAYELLNIAAARGNADAQFSLGLLYGNVFQNITNYLADEALALVHLYAASTQGHPGAVMAMGYRHMNGFGVPKTCTTAALNYIEYAKNVTGIYSEGMPQAVELVRLNLEKDRKSISSSEINLFMQIASGGDTGVAAAIGKRYLLGIDGFKQNYDRALQYLRIAANNDHPGALSLLGYMYCLGLNVEKNLDVAYAYFVSAAAQDDALAHNGLGYIYYVGSGIQKKNLKLAFEHFNKSAFGGSADGMFNLASVYLSGQGAELSFRKAALWYTQALDRGHTPAAYSLAIMHLNGIGTVRDCNTAVKLLKQVTERGKWVSDKLNWAYDLQEKFPDAASWLFLKVAETGHEVAQMNAAHLLDTQASFLFFDSPPGFGEEVPELMKKENKVYAQRFYEMSADHGSASSELRLGDFAYYGWGLQVAVEDVEDHLASDSLWDDYYLQEEQQMLSRDTRFQWQNVSYDAALAHYRKTASMKITGEWMQSFVSRASFNMGYMHQFGIGIARDLTVAKRHYQRCMEIDPNGVTLPITIMIGVLQLQKYIDGLPTQEELTKSMDEDIRIHGIALLTLFFILMMHLRIKLNREQ